MKVLSLILAALMYYVSNSYAESTKEALEKFEILGTWSLDCVKDPKKDGARLIFAAPFLGAATATTIFPQGEATDEISFAERITEEKIRMVSTSAKRVGTFDALDKLVRGQPIEDVWQRTGKSLLQIESHTVDGKVTIVKDGVIFSLGADGQMHPANAFPPLERCLN